MTGLFAAIDTPDLSRALGLARSLSVTGPGAGIKLGLEFFCAHGPEGVRLARQAAPAAPLFLDLKLHDIPNTVAGAVRAAAALGVDFLTVHAAGGPDMLRAAAAEKGAMRLLAVTVLTSLDAAALDAVGQGREAEAQVSRLAALAAACGIDGVVSSPLEIGAVRRAAPGLLSVVPGIRPAGAAAGDQRRVMTPAQAAAAGADWIVVGRPITEAQDPAAAALGILRELQCRLS